MTVLLDFFHTAFIPFFITPSFFNVDVPEIDGDKNIIRHNKEKNLFSDEGDVRRLPAATSTSFCSGGLTEVMDVGGSFHILSLLQIFFMSPHVFHDS